MNAKLDDTPSTPRPNGAPASVPKFPLGQTLITPNALSRLDAADVQLALGRHVRGDWGDCGPEDRRENEYALPRHLRLLSVYHDRNGRKFWIITEADRSATTVLMPDDY